MTSSIVRARYFVLAGALAGWFAVLYPRDARKGDWLVFEYGARILSGTAGPRFDALSQGPLHVYVDMPKLQVGPPALLAAVPPSVVSPTVGRLLAAAVMTAALLLLVAILERTTELAGADRTALRTRVLLGGLALAPVWTILAARYMHLDDVLALVLLGVGCHALIRGRWWVMALALGTGTAAKPWAVGFLALLLALPRARVASAVVAAVSVVVAWWLPFVLAAPDTVVALGTVDNGVTRDSTVGLLVGSTPPGGRVVQLAVVVAVGVLLARRGLWPTVPVVAMAIRVTLDWQWWLYYGAALVAGALLVDLVCRRTWVPWTTLAAVAATLAPAAFGVSSFGPGAEVAVRTALLAATVVLALRACVGWARRNATASPASSMDLSTTVGGIAAASGTPAP